jgi:hypothetical protein
MGKRKFKPPQDISVLPVKCTVWFALWPVCAVGLVLLEGSVMGHFGKRTFLYAQYCCRTVCSLNIMGYLCKKTSVNFVRNGLCSLTERVSKKTDHGYMLLSLFWKFKHSMHDWVILNCCYHWSRIGWSWLPFCPNVILCAYCLWGFLKDYV